MLIAAAANIVLWLPLGKAERVALLLGLGAHAVCQWRRLARSQSLCRRIRIGCDGSAAVETATADWVPATLMAGSVLLARVGWLRLQGSDGNRYLEPIRGARRLNREWRRLHVIWQHIGATS